MLVHADAQALQNPVTAERGIGRYVAELAAALESGHPGAVTSWLIRPDMPVPVHTPALVRSALFRRSDDLDLAAPDVWFQPSPFESLDDDVDSLWPTWARGSRTRLVTTLYDLIPLIYSDVYFADDAFRRAYLARVELVRSADRILAISETTARDGVRLLGIPARRFEVVGTGVSAHFRPASSIDESVRTAGAAVPGLRDGYLLYTGGIDFRKNIDTLLEGYALLAPSVRAAHQLVIVCRIQPADRERLERRLAELGVAGDVLLPGFVPEPALPAVYQAARLFVFPSLYEGFGLPVAEALACGTPAIVGDTPALAELVTDPAWRFDATAPQAIADAILRGLADDESGVPPPLDDAPGRYTWQSVAARTADALHDVTARNGRRPQQRPRVAFVTPMPPTPSGVADYSAAMLEHLRTRADIDVFTEAGASRPPIDGVTWYTYRDLRAVERVHGDHDARIVAMGNSEHHLECLDTVRSRRCTVICHDVRYSDLLSVALRDRPELIDDETRAALASLHAGRLPDEHAAHVTIDPADYWTVNGLMCGPILDRADAAFVHSDVAAMLARADLPADRRQRVTVAPFGHVLRTPGRDRDTVASFGIVHWLKESVTLARAFVRLAERHPELRFALVGRAGDEATGRQVEDVIAEADLGDRVVFTGRVSAADYDSWLSRAILGVQLRLHSNGETSAAVADCLGAGVPVMASNTGALAALADCVHLVEPAIELDALVESIEALITDRARRDLLAADGRRHAETNTFAAAAHAVLDTALGTA